MWSTQSIRLLLRQARGGLRDRRRRSPHSIYARNSTWNQVSKSPEFNRRPRGRTSRKSESTCRFKSRVFRRERTSITTATRTLNGGHTPPRSGWTPRASPCELARVSRTTLLSTGRNLRRWMSHRRPSWRIWKTWAPICRLRIKVWRSSSPRKCSRLILIRTATERLASPTCAKETPRRKLLPPKTPYKL